MNDTTKRFLAFSLGPEEFAVPLLCVREVIAAPECTPVPYTPSYFLGVMNLRGQVVSILDLRLKFGMKNVKTAEETAVVILDLNDTFLGVVVDSVNTVMNLLESDIHPAPKLDGNHTVEYVLGVARAQEKLTLLLDIAKTLNVEDIAVINREVRKKVA